MFSEEASTHPYRALLIEDDATHRRMILRALEKGSVRFNYDHVICINEAKEILQKRCFDLIITDLNLPDSKGIETIDTLLTLSDDIPIVVLSDINDDILALEAVHTGAQDYIPKQYIDDINLINRTLRQAVERHQLKASLERTRDKENFLTHYDSCTSLPNRLLLMDRLQQAVAQAQRNQQEFSLFFIDLDGFKNINDSLGHSAGDQVLYCVGERIRSLVRASDTVARLGGDEFILILQKSHNNDAMEHLAQKIITAINHPIPFGQRQCTVGASIGIASFPSHGYTTEQLIKSADIAMCEAKQKGPNQLMFFTQELLEQKDHFFSLEKILREALRKPDENFELYYRPRIELKADKVCAYEALIRWPHINLGNIPPDQFIPLAEDLGLIEKIDEWVLEKACRQVMTSKLSETNTRISVKISGHSFNQRTFTSNVIGPLLKKYNISGNSLEIEITERALLVDTQQVDERMLAIKQLGINLVMDDFGTGLSSLSYLNRLPIDILKIDGSFICDYNGSYNQQALLKAIIAICEALEMKVIVEGIETTEQKNYLLGLCCYEGQGFYLGKPSTQGLRSTK